MIWVPSVLKILTPHYHSTAYFDKDQDMHAGLLECCSDNDWYKTCICIIIIWCALDRFRWICQGLDPSVRTRPFCSVFPDLWFKAQKKQSSMSTHVFHLTLQSLSNRLTPPHIGFPSKCFTDFILNKVLMLKKKKKKKKAISSRGIHPREYMMTSKWNTWSICSRMSKTTQLVNFRCHTTPAPEVMKTAAIQKSTSGDMSSVFVDAGLGKVKS